MKFSHLLGTVNSYLIMTIVYFLVIGPVSLLLKLFRVDVLDSRRPAESNWRAMPDEEKDADFYKRLS